MTRPTVPAVSAEAQAVLDAVEPLGVRIAKRLTARERQCADVAQRSWRDRSFTTAAEFQVRADAFDEARSIVAEECQRTPVPPVSEVVDRADAQELAELARDGAIQRHYDACLDNSRFVTCKTPRCVDYRALLARFDAPGVTA